MFLNKIYKETATGKVQEWAVEVVNNKYRTISGQIDGKKVISEWTVCTGKNIGRANETTPKEQAMAEALAKRKKKLEKDYSETIKKAKASDFLQPMLAKNFDDYEDELEYPVYIQPKLDGIRCENTEDGLLTRNGKDIVSCPHIHAPSTTVFGAYAQIRAIDGELYNHYLKEDFNKITSLVKKLKPTDDDIKESKDLIQHWVYDIMMPGSFSERYKFLKDLFKSPLIKNAGWVLVPTYKCNNRAELDAHYEKFLEDGYEGGIIRIDAAYENKRSKYLLKRKEFQDEEFPVLDIVEGIGNRSGMAGYIETQTKDKKSFKSNIKGDRAFLKDLLKNKKKFIGKTATIKFFRYTPDGIPRFPVVKEFSRESYD